MENGQNTIGGRSCMDGMEGAGRGFSIGMISDEERLRSSCIGIRITRVLSESSQLIGSSTMDENRL